MKNLHRLAAFIDWNSQLVAYGGELSPKDAAAKVLSCVARRISKALSFSFSDDRFIVGIRLYHGWHHGFEPTANRRAIVQVIAEADFSALSVRSNVVFSGEVGYGDRLVFADPKRLHPKLSIHLPNTVRSQRRKQPLEEKMVDTALAADLVSLAAQEPMTWLMVVAEDDDFVPPLFVAEALLGRHASRALLLRKQRKGPFLRLDGILCGGDS